MKIKHFALLFAILLQSIAFAGQHTGPDYEVKAYNALDKVGATIAKKYNLTFLNSGLGTRLVGSDRCSWALNLMGRQQYTIDQLRPIAIEITNILLHQVYSDPVYLISKKKLFENYHIGSPNLNTDLVGFRLTFWDSNMDRPQKPYVSQVRLSDNKLYFYYADPITQALESPISEPLSMSFIDQNSL